jgi:hypothetical protein
VRLRLVDDLSPDVTLTMPPPSSITQLCTLVDAVLTRAAGAAHHILPDKNGPDTGESQSKQAPPKPRQQDAASRERAARVALLAASPRAACVIADDGCGGGGMAAALCAVRAIACVAGPCGRHNTTQRRTLCQVWQPPPPDPDHGGRVYGMGGGGAHHELQWLAAAAAGAVFAASFHAASLTGIHPCILCSCHEILRAQLLQVALHVRLHRPATRRLAIVHAVSSGCRRPAQRATRRLLARWGSALSARLCRTG